MIRTVETTGSTNADMLAAAAAHDPEGSWLRAERQDGGRGRLGRGWESPEGNLHASTIVRLAAGDGPAPTLALVAAIAVHDATATFADPENSGIRIKWPNDLVAGRAKVAGLLLERSGDAVVIGFGVNLANAPEVPGRETASFASLGLAVPAPDVFAEVLADAFARWMRRWRGEGMATIVAAWQRRAHPIGTPLGIEGREGLFDGLDADGALRLRLAGGETLSVHAGDVFLL